MALRLQLLLLVLLARERDAARVWPVTMIRGAERTVLNCMEGRPILASVERAGLLPNSDCRRGNCLSCVIRSGPTLMQPALRLTQRRGAARSPADPTARLHVSRPPAWCTARPSP
jgi:ferredoxin